MTLYHYYDQLRGPFRTLSDLDPKTATNLIQTITKTAPNSFCAKRSPAYIKIQWKNLILPPYRLPTAIPIQHLANEWTMEKSNEKNYTPTKKFFY